MNTPPSASSPLHALLRPLVFFPTLAALVVLSVLFTPQATSPTGAPAPRGTRRKTRGQGGLLALTL